MLPLANFKPLICKDEPNLSKILEKSAKIIPRIVTPCQFSAAKKGSKLLKSRTDVMIWVLRKIDKTEFVLEIPDFRNLVIPQLRIVVDKIIKLIFFLNCKII